MSDNDLKKQGIFSWPVWEKEISRFDWYYEQSEQCYILAGKVTVLTKDGSSVEFGKGDFVTFPKGFSCTWDIKESVKKHYNFK